MKRITIAAARATALAAGLACAQAVPASADQGVSDSEVVIGSHNDLSGPFAAFGAPAVNAANMYFNAVNAKGGVHGRTIRFVVEDHGYQVPRAVQAINKLVNRDKIFAMTLALGTPQNLAAFRLMDPKGIPNLSPLSAARQLLQEPVANKFVGGMSYYDGIRVGTRWLAENRDLKTVCTMYIPSDFGKEIQEGARDEAEAMGLAYASETTHKPDETDYTGSLAKLKDAGCELIATALSVRGTITAVATAKKMGWSEAVFLASSAGFHPAVASVPGGVTEGLYAAAPYRDLAARRDEPAVKAWMEAYEAEFGQEASVGAMLGYSAADTLVRALEAAGPDLTTQSFLAAMETLDFTDEIAGNAVTYGPGDHVGTDTAYLSVVQDGGWVIVAEGLAY